MFHALRVEAESVPPAALPDVSRRLWAVYGTGALTDEQVEAIEAVIRARQEGQNSPRTAAVPLGHLKSIFPARRLQRAPDRSVAIERRRRLAASGPMPPAMAARFTTGQLSVLKIVADEVASQGSCELCIDALAARAGVSRRLAQGAIRLAEGDGLLLIMERRQQGDRNLPNVLRVLNREWLAWIAHGRRQGGGCKSLRPTDTASQNLETTEPVRSGVQAARGQGRALTAGREDSQAGPSRVSRVMRRGHAADR